MRSDDEAVDALRRAHREASQQLDGVASMRRRCARCRPRQPRLAVSSSRVAGRFPRPRCWWCR